MINRLKEVNKREVYDINHDKFKDYGRVIDGYDFSELINYMNEKSEMPKEGNVYYPSIDEMEKTEVFKKIKSNFYGDMDTQIGYCNGDNSTLNGFEYHKGSEINIAVTDFVLILGHKWDIENNTYDVKNVEFFYVKKGEAIEMFETTLHLSPCKVNDYGFKDIVILPKGTNTKLDYKKDIIEKEDELLLMRNKWVLAHPERKRLIDMGAKIGINGENLKVEY